MNLRNSLLLAGLAVLMAGCVVTPRPSYRDYEQPYDEGYYDYRNTPSYEGYYYVRIIFIGNVPYYVDDNRYIRPIPPRLYDNFRSYPYNSLGRPPVFSRDTEVRDGYPVSRIIYLDGVPYIVENNRIAQPLPERLQPRFRYTPADQGNAPAKDNRYQPPMQNPGQPSAQHDNGRNNEAPANIMDQIRERIQQPPPVHGQPQGERDTSVDSKGRMILSPEPRILPSRQDKINAGSHADTANDKARDRNDKRPQAVDDTAKKQADKKADKKADQKSKDKKKSGKGNKDQQDDSTQTDDGSDNNKGDGKKPHKRKNDDQGNSTNGNWRD